MIVAVITALATLFYISGWLMFTGYLGWAASGSKTFPGLIFSAGFALFVIGVGLTIRVLSALLGVI
jgi:hypothetical protein